MNVLRAEWIKLWSVRSTGLALGCAALFAIGLGLSDTLGTVRAWDTMAGPDRAAFDAVGSSLSGLTFGQLAFGVLGVLAASSEYAMNGILATLTATPRRGVVFAAKVVVLGGTTLVAGLALAFGSFFLGQAVLTRRQLDAHLGDPGVLRAVASAGLCLFVVALVGLGLGALIRHTAGAIAALIGLVFLAYGAARAVEGWSYLPSRLLLSNAEDVVAQVHAAALKPRLPSLTLAYVDLALYLVVILGLGAWRARRDS
jgi:ABC-2 type transport system permease protein